MSRDETEVGQQKTKQKQSSKRNNKATAACSLAISPDKIAEWWRWQKRNSMRNNHEDSEKNLELSMKIHPHDETGRLEMIENGR